jgi:hypothetical protein
MKLINTLISTLFVLTFSSVFAADTVETTNIGNAEVSSYYQLTDTGVAILTLVARVSETNNALRGLKNLDQRRLSKLGQLTYQCKLMLYKSDKNNQSFDEKDLNLTSRNFSLFTGVDLPLAADERLGIQVEALQTMADSSLFTANLGNQNSLRKERETVDDGSNINLEQFDINVLNETDLIETSESIEIVARFPIFQLEKPVSQWRYNFNLKDFKQAVAHIDENCTPIKFIALINQ